MRVYNKSSRIYQHTYIDDKNVFHAINLNPKTDAEIPDDIAKAWLKTGEVVEYVKPEEAKEQQAKLEKAKAELEAENAKLKAELEALKNVKPEEAKAQNPDAQSDDIEELKKEAEKLGIQFAPNIGAEKLKAKIEAKKAEQQ